jgi:hypothetical protein
MTVRRPATIGARLAALLGMAAVPLCVSLSVSMPAQAQEFHLYLKCSGQIETQGRHKSAHLDLALRDNNMSALIQRSNVLPVGERLKYEASPALYSMTAHAPRRGSVVYYDWIRGELFVWNPQLAQLSTVRLSIDRQSGELEGELLDGKGADMGRLRLRCDPKTNDDIAKPRF